jgi:ubiquinol oxidase
VTFGDKAARWTVKAMRWPTDIFFQRRYGCRAMMLETVAAVPGMVAGAALHLRSLRRFEHSGGWVRALLEEAENERMHLMTFMEVSRPRWYERALVIAVQGVFLHAYLAAYLISPATAHRAVGYLEEEAVHSYTEFLRDIDAGKIENVPAPAIAVDYWRLRPGATLRDVVEAVRADEAHHRDVNHYASVSRVHSALLVSRLLLLQKAVLTVVHVPFVNDAGHPSPGPRATGSGCAARIPLRRVKRPINPTSNVSKTE